jgi:putative transposase
MSYFIVGVTHNRKTIFEDKTNLEVLRETLRNVKTIHPFTMQGYVFLPDHFHLLIIPEETTNITKILHSVQRNFTLNFKKARAITEPLRCWQHRFWDHIIRNEKDYERHLNYIHYNPVKHGYVTRPEDWADSSYHYYLEKGYYEPGWGHIEPKDIGDMDVE